MNKQYANTNNTIVGGINKIGSNLILLHDEPYHSAGASVMTLLFKNVTFRSTVLNFVNQIYDCNSITSKFSESYGNLVYFTPTDIGSSIFHIFQMLSLVKNNDRVY